MRNDQLPEDNAESERAPHRHDPTFMDYTSLVTLQQRLDALEGYYGDQYSHNDSVLMPRVARVAPMSATAESARRGLPSIDYRRPVATIDISALHLPNPTAASFINAAAAAATAVSSAAPAAAAPCLNIGVRSVQYAPHSASYATAPSNTATYASPPVSYTTTMPSLYCVASTSHALNPGYSRSPATNSDTDSATSTEIPVAPDHDYDMIPAFRRRALDHCDHVNTEVFSRRTIDDDKDIDERVVPRKIAKRSEEHVTAVTGARNAGRGIGDDDDDEDDDDDDDDDDGMDCD